MIDAVQLVADRKPLWLGWLLDFCYLAAKLLVDNLYLLGMLGELCLDSLHIELDWLLLLVAIFEWPQLHKGIDIQLKLSDHMFLEHQVVGSSQMVVLVIFD